MGTKAPVRAPVVMPRDAQARYAILSLRSGSHVRLRSGDFEVEGILLNVVRPAASSLTVIVTIDSTAGRIVGPVLAGDLLVA